MGRKQLRRHERKQIEEIALEKTETWLRWENVKRETQLFLMQYYTNQLYNNQDRYESGDYQVRLREE